MSSDRETTTLPYQVGKCLQLQVLDNSHGLAISQSITAIITKVFSVTMSPVMSLMIIPESGPRIRAVLKLYDRRFGEDLREARRTHIHHTSAREAAFQSFARQGRIAPFLRQLEHNENTLLYPPTPWHYLREEDGQEKYETLIWRKCNGYFNCESQTYERLKDLQGQSIPQLYSRVRLLDPAPGFPQDLVQQPDLAPYFEIKGILLEYIPGYNLSDLATSPWAPSDTVMWPLIVQSAVDAAHNINRHDIIMEDCGPRNVIVHKDSHCPFIIDLAQCATRDQLIEERESFLQLNKDKDEESETNGDSESDDGEWDPEIYFWEEAKSNDNPRAIGAVMANILLRGKEFNLDITYPDVNKIISDIKARKGV